MTATEYAHSRQFWQGWQEGFKMNDCKCTTLAQHVLGDGCEVCNPAKALKYAKETITDLMAERDRYREVLKEVREQITDCLERDAKAFMGMTMEQVEAWNIARHNQTHGWVLDRIKDALA